jgi:O-antigen ligase
MDNIPFGTGFGTYATYASGEYYSPVYIKYGMENMHGLSKAEPAFIADTYFPALAQFGIVGVVLFFSFWIILAVKALKSYSKGSAKEATMILMTVIFFMIESTSDSTITHNRGMFIMMILGLLLYNMDEHSFTEHKLSEDKP